LLRSRQIPDLLDNPVVVEIATRIEKSPAQVLLRYLVELGVSVIPKSTNPNRLKSNLDLFGFELSADDKEKLAGLDANIRICDFAFFQGIQKHPEFPFEQMKN
jgi:alcohol dehydrogenase (NADP+)